MASYSSRYTLPVALLSVGLCITALAVASTASAISYPNGKKSTGTLCSKAGLTTKTGSTALKCVKSGKKLVWENVKRSKPAKPSRVTKSSTSPSAKPSTVASIPAAQSSYDITVASSQWNFAFAYFVGADKTGLPSASTDSSVLYIPEGKLVHFTLTSADTTHGFWVPGLLIDSAMDPGVTGHVDFTASKLGTFPGHCNVSSCGRGHAGMAFTVKVVSPEEYLKYLSSLK